MKMYKVHNCKVIVFNRYNVFFISCFGICLKRLSFVDDFSSFFVYTPLLVSSSVLRFISYHYLNLSSSLSFYLPSKVTLSYTINYPLHLLILFSHSVSILVFLFFFVNYDLFLFVYFHYNLPFLLF